LGIFIQSLNPRAKALEPNQNKNAQIQVVKLSKQKVFVKLKKKQVLLFTFGKNVITSKTKPTLRELCWTVLDKLTEFCRFSPLTNRSQLTTDFLKEFQQAQPVR
jgi:hypothetical protein